MAIRMAPSRYSNNGDSDSDSDNDLPELDELISKHVKGMTAPKLNAKKTAIAPSSPKKTAARATVKKNDTANTTEQPSTSSARVKTTELKSAPELRRPAPEPKLHSTCHASATRKKDTETNTRTSSRRNLRPTAYRLPRIEDTDSEEQEEEEEEEVEEQDAEESLLCESDTEPTRPMRRLVSGRETPDVDSGDSDEDVFHTPPTMRLQNSDKSRLASKPSDHLTQKLLQLDLQDSDKENDNRAILKFSPPRAARPIVLERPATPPPASPTKSRLVSPSKKNQRIPTPPHAPNFEDFWNVHAVNTWNDKHSPQKPLLSPKKIRNALQEDSDSPSSSSLKKTTSPSKKSRAELDAKKDFESRKHQLAEDFLVELDHKITDNKIKDLAALTGGVKFIWSKTLNSTAGRANWRRETTTRRNLDGTTTITQKHHASIELAEKVIDDEERLLNVVAHEFCHLANFMVSGIKDQPHGQQFKAWGSKCSKAFAHRGVNVTTKHSYRIDYKYIWTCTNDACNHEFKRHSKSIDPARHLCGVCRGKLAQTKPVPRKQTAGGPTSYAAFVKATFAGLKAEMVGAAHKDVMAALGKKYREQKAEREAAASLKGVDDVAKALEVVNLDSD